VLDFFRNHLLALAKAAKCPKSLLASMKFESPQYPPPSQSPAHYQPLEEMGKCASESMAYTWVDDGDAALAYRREDRISNMALEA
jgi:hypothetical protein